MRIIAGEFRGRRLAAPPGDGTRPLLDRIREALFSTLGETVVDARVLDLFAGTGSLALEALSRGAASALMVERDRRTLEVARSNVETLGVADQVRLVRDDALRPTAWGRREDGRRFDLVFLDPPYPVVSDPQGRREVLAALEQLLAERLAPEGVLVLHAHKRALDEDAFAARVPRLRLYGNSALWYFDGDGDA